ncbi:MAG TPA: hypothetical protein VL463_12735 [Kofleriaceae bacterium]|nr:hypothetical protein [Kofleriaceae bacterium]
MIEILDSFEKLEVVLALHGAQPPRAAVALANDLHLDPIPLDEALRGLVSAHVLEKRSDGYRLEANGPWARHVEALVEMQRADRMQVVTLMSKTALERMRARANRAFADAFVIAKKKDGGGSDG